MRPFFSIIIPVYNGDGYLQLTLDSILSQNFKDYEMILLNDGSTDNSLKICLEYSERDSHFVFIDKQNEGVSKTRNRGLDIAKGEYVLFVDSDDILYAGSLKMLYDNLKNNDVDIMHFEHRYINEKGKECFPNYEKNRRRKYNSRFFHNYDFIDKILRDEFYLCMNVFKRSIFEENSIRFLDGCTYNEDTDLLIRYLINCEKCAYTSIVVYGYRKFDGAVTHGFTERNFNDVMKVFVSAQNLSRSCENSKYAKSIKFVAEGLGLLLYNHCGRYGDSRIKKDIIRYTTKGPIRMEWKVFPFCGNRLWWIINILRKVYRRFY